MLACVWIITKELFDLQVDLEVELEMELEEVGVKEVEVKEVGVKEKEKEVEEAPKWDDIRWGFEVGQLWKKRME